MPLRNIDKTTRNRNKKNLSKFVILLILGLRIAKYRFLPLSESRAFLWNLLEAEMAQSKEALTINLYGAFSECSHTQKITAGRLLELRTCLAKGAWLCHSLFAAHLRCNSLLQNKCWMLFSLLFIKVKESPLPILWVGESRYCRRVFCESKWHNANFGKAGGIYGTKSLRSTYA